MLNYTIELTYENLVRETKKSSFTSGASMAQIFSQPFFPDGFHLRKEKEDGIPWEIWAHLSLPVQGVGNTCCMTWGKKWTFLVPNHGKKHWKPSWETWLPKVAQLMKNLHDR
jgi:hypothetical protein